MIAITTALTNWIPQVVSRYLNEDWNPTNQGFGAQCWDVPANWSKYLGLPVISTNGKGRWPGWAGNMVDAFPQSPAIAAAYELLPPSATVLGGDILVWDDSNKAVYPKTHVAVAVRDLGAMLLCISQNSSASLPGNPYPQWTTGPTILQHLPRKGLLGIIRPRTGINPQSTTTSEEDDVSAQEVLSWPIERTDGQKSTVAVELAKIGPDLGKLDTVIAILSAMAPEVTESMLNDRKQVHSLEDVRAAISQLDAPTIVSAVPADLVKKVLDGLAERLAT
ncbi:hypothetical protein [Arthrobacter sp. UYCu712]|uniref:hypothetical protein n=1 Tax=Arthrobacter sp. UYCu712 TaxID=3156340 RepID=UPI00339353C3